MASTYSSSVQRFGGFEVDPRARELRCKGIRIRVQDQPLEVLLVLLARKGEVVTREELKQSLWPAGTFVDADDGLNTAVRKLRELLGDSAERPVFIETIPRRGYRFIEGMQDLTISSPAQANSATAAARAQTMPRQAASVQRRVPWPWVAATFGCVLLALSTWMIVRHQRAVPRSGTRIASLAVLPLRNLSGDPSQEYFADGITESLIGRLSAIRGLRVISRTSSMQFRNTRMSAPEIGNALNVDALVEGSVIREGGHVRVHAQLIRAATDEHFWSETYDRETDDTLALESEVAQAIAQKIEVTVSGEEHARLITAHLVSPEVYESYLKGRRLVEGNRKEEIQAAVAYFENAIQKDASFAPAYEGLAQAYSNLGQVFIGMPPAETRPKVIEAARKAIELQPDLADAHVQLGAVYQRQWQWNDAEDEFNRALQLNPNDAFAMNGYAGWLVCQGRFDQALAWGRRARELDPLGPSGTQIGWILFHARRYDEAIRELRSVIAVQPDHAMANWFLGLALIGRGKPEEAIPVLQRTVALTGRSPGAVDVLAAAHAQAGHRAEALRLIAELNRRRKTGYVPPGAFVFSHLAVGDREEAYVWLEQSFQEKSNLMQFLKVHPLFDPLRDDPRFSDLVRRVGLAQ